MDINERKQQLDAALLAYNQGNPIMSDEEYDKLLEEYLSVVGEENRPYLRQKQTEGVNKLVGTLPKVYGVTIPMREGLKTYRDWAVKQSRTDSILAQPKFDGVSIAYDCDTHKFFTRGDVDDGESCDVTNLFAAHRKMKEFESFETKYSSIKFEGIIDKHTFEFLQTLPQFKDQKYVTPRAMLSGMITRSNAGKDYGEFGTMISLMPLRAIRRDDSTEVIPTELQAISRQCSITDYDAISDFIEGMLSNNATIIVEDMVYAVDGCVVSMIIRDRHDDTNEQSLIVKDEVAIKILNLRKTSKLIDIDCRYGTNGAITPVAIIEPVKFDNITVTNITVSNFTRVEALDLQINDEVEVMYNIVPYLVGSKHTDQSFKRKEFFCPECGTRLVVEAGYNLNRIECPNDRCPGKVKGQIARYCETMKFFGVSSGIISKLYDAKILRSIPDLYELTVDKIKDLEGFGEASARRILGSIKDGSENVQLEKWLSAFPFVNISTNKWRMIIRGMNASTDNNVVDFIREMIESDDKIGFINSMVPCEGITYNTIKKVSEGVFQYWDDIRSVYAHITFDKTPISNKNKPRVAMSGTRDAEITEYLENKGYEVGGYTTNCVALIVPNKDFKSSKVTNAKRDMIPIYTLDEVKERL